MKGDAASVSDISEADWKKRPRKYLQKKQKQPRKYVQIVVTLPEPYLRILMLEAEQYGLRRSQFAEQLLFDSLRPRRANAPKYEFTEDELRCRQRFLWYIRSEIRVVLDKQRLSFGGLTVSAWMVVSLNRWLGGEPAMISAA
jgi:hypothetical protein